MYGSMISLLIVFFAVVFTSLVSKDIPCEVVLNATNGFRIDIQYDRNGDPRYILSDKKEMEWTMNLWISPNEMIINGFYDGKNSTKDSIVDKFGVKCLQCTDCKVVNCRLNSNNLLHCKCESGRPSKGTQTFNQLQNPIIFKPYPSRYQTDFSYLVAINKLNTEETTKIGWRIQQNKKYRYYEIKIDLQQTKDAIQPFIKEMKQTLVTQIDSIVDYNISYPKSSGWIIWFFIDGRNYYCTQPENQSLSQQCKDEKSLIPMFDYCFKSSPVIETDYSVIVWVIIAIIVLTIAIIAIIVFILWFVRRKDRRDGQLNQSRKQSKSSGTTMKWSTISQSTGVTKDKDIALKTKANPHGPKQSPSLRSSKTKKVAKQVLPPKQSEPSVAQNVLE